MAALEAAGWLRLPRWAPGPLLCAAFALWVVAGGLSGLGADAVDAVFGGVAVLGVVASSGHARFPRAVVALGEASYGMYLWHWLVLNVLRWAAASAGISASIWTNQVGDWMIVVALTFPIAWLSWTRIERPAIAWARGRRAAPRPATVGAVQ
ncbi:MAG TPA: acyltransferase family protein [Candidatus Dormibacteraeota bacterium]|nr:acyltransferase family protein [Candidatus Dormibacteraeota bacterium]